MRREIKLHSSDFHFPPDHPLHEHLFILLEYAAPPSQRELARIDPASKSHPMFLIIEHRYGHETPYATKIAVADEESFATMWNAFASNSKHDILKKYGLEHLCR